MRHGDAEAVPLRKGRGLVRSATFTQIEDDVASYQAIYGVLPDDLSQMGDGNLRDPWAIRTSI